MPPHRSDAGSNYRLQGNRMYQVKKILSLVVMLGITLFAVQAEAAKFKKWKNKDGEWEYGLTIPPEYAQQAHEELSGTGVVVDKTQRAKTDEELAAERKQREHDERVAAEEKQRSDLQAAEDRVLLDTFSSEDDMILTRDGKLSNIDSDITLIQSRIASLQKNLDQMISQAADDQRAGKPPSEKITKDIANVRRQIAQNNAFIDKKHAEQELVKQEFEKDVQRFRELKGMQ